MKLTQLEQNVVNAIGKMGGMGVRTMMPLIADLDCKTQLKNVLLQLEEKAILKNQRNGQWTITKAKFQELTDIGALDRSVKPLPMPAHKNTETVKPESFSEETNEKLASETVETLEVGEVESNDDHPATSAEDMLFRLMQAIPDGAEMQISGNQVRVLWNSQYFEPGLDDLADVLTAIVTLQQHAA